jgi:hypothetical protein
MMKKRNKNWIPLLATFMGLVLVGCSDSSQLVPEIDLEKQVTVKSSATFGLDGATGGRLMTAVALDKFLVNAGNIELEIDETDERSASTASQSEPEFEGPFILDLLANELAVDLAGAEIPVGIYNQIEFELMPSSDATSELNGKSVLIEGSIDGIPFVFWTDEREEFEINFSSNGGDLVVSETGFVVVINFNLDAVFGVNGSVDLSKATDGNLDGLIEIHPDDPDGNNVLAVKILSELEEATESKEDEDLDEDGKGNDEDDDIDGDGVNNDEDEDDDNDGSNDDEDNDDDGDGVDDDQEDDGEKEEDEEDDEDDEDDREESAINTILMSSDWTLTSYIDASGTEIADVFTGYVFTFDQDENLIVDNLETQIEGEWEAITNREEPLLLLEFEVEEGPFEQLEDDWTILSAGDAKVELSSDSDEGTKTLVLEKQ